MFSSTFSASGYLAAATDLRRASLERCRAPSGGRTLMNNHRGVESDFELTTIERMEKLGYKHLVGVDLDRPHEQVVFGDALEANLRRRYLTLPDASIKEAVA